MVPSTLNYEKAELFILMPLFLYCIRFLVILVRYMQKQKYDIFLKILFQIIFLTDGHDNTI